MQREKLQTPQKLKRLKRLRLKRSKELPRFKAPGIWGFLMHKKYGKRHQETTRYTATVDMRRLFHFVYATRVVCDLFVFVDVSMIDVRRFHTFYTCCSQHRCVWLLDFSRCSLMPL